MKIKFHEALQILLNHRSREVVYYSIGIQINLTHDPEFKNTQVAADIFKDLIEILEECTIDDVDILNCSLKAQTNLICDPVITKLNQNSEKSICEDRNTGFNLLKNLEGILNKYDEECDIIQSCDEVSEEEKEEIVNLKNIICTVMKIIPEDSKFECTYASCGRVFKSKDEQTNHVNRRHKVRHINSLVST